MHRVPIVAAATALLCSTCLPDDDRPVPGSVLITAEPNRAISAGFETADGWSISFDRFVTALGGVDLDSDPDGRDDSCNAYSDARYDWLFDFTVASREKVGIVYGLGTCSVEFRLRSPSDDTVLGAGVDSSDADFMRTLGPDLYAPAQRIALFARGEARRGDVTKRFEWSFRNGFEYDRCPTADGDDYVSVFSLEGGDAISLGLLVRGDELFRSAPVDDAPLAFDRYAAADLDDNDLIDLQELAQAEAPPSDDWFDAIEPTEGAPILGPPVSMADLLYLWLLPRVIRMENGGACSVELR